MTAGSTRVPSYFQVWRWLVVLLVLALLPARLPVSREVVAAAVLGIAVVKATLVGRHYMHLRSESLLVYAIAGIPVLLFLGLVLTLVPDIVLRR